jgi:hypothetical protein
MRPLLALTTIDYISATSKERDAALARLDEELGDFDPDLQWISGGSPQPHVAGGGSAQPDVATGGSAVLALSAERSPQRHVAGGGSARLGAQASRTLPFDWVGCDKCQKWRIATHALHAKYCQDRTEFECGDFGIDCTTECDSARFPSDADKIARLGELPRYISAARWLKLQTLMATLREVPIEGYIAYIQSVRESGQSTVDGYNALIEQNLGIIRSASKLKDSIPPEYSLRRLRFAIFDHCGEEFNALQAIPVSRMSTVYRFAYGEYVMSSLNVITSPPVGRLDINPALCEGFLIHFRYLKRFVDDLFHDKQSLDAIRAIVIPMSDNDKKWLIEQFGKVESHSHELVGTPFELAFDFIHEPLNLIYLASMEPSSDEIRLVVGNFLSDMIHEIRNDDYQELIV